MKTFLTTAAFAVLLSAAIASDPEETDASRPLFNFTLLPKAFVRNPQLEMTVFTELTDYGRTLPIASPESPVHFVAYDKGGRSMGAGVAGERLPVPAELMTILHGALAERGYLPAPEDDSSPDLVVILHWGSHYRLDIDLAGLFPELHQQQMLERATLVGGRAYRNEVQRQIEFGWFPGDRSFKKGRLFDQATADLYYVVVSAYDHASVLNDTPRLAWRTTMTVSAAGLSMQDSLPSLIMTAAPYFGREMTDPAALVRNVRRGTVTMGPLRIIEDDEPPLPPPPAK